MAEPTHSPRDITVRNVPIDLSQLLKFSGLAATGGAAKQAITDRRVHVNGELETRKGRKLVAGDRVTIDGQEIVVRVGAGHA